MEFDLKQENDAVYRYRLKTGKEGDHDRGPQIVFIHGLQPEESRSPYFEPWLTEDGRELWPKSWLSESFPTATMYLVHYDSCPRKDDTTSCSHLRAVTPQHFQRTDVKIRSRALIVQRGLENLLDVILKGQRKVERVTAADLLSYLCANYSSMRARVCAMPEAATGLARLLNDDGADVQMLALQTIMVLFRGSETDHVLGFIRQIALVSGVVERIIEFTRDDWGDKPILAMRIVEAYLHAESGNFPPIFAVEGMVQDMVTWMKNKRQNAFKISCTLQFLNGFSRDTSNLSFFLSIRGSVEAVVELVAHYTKELQLDGSEKERTERVKLIEKCFILLRQIANASEEANFQIARLGSLLDLTLDLLDKRQRESVQMKTIDAPTVKKGSSTVSSEGLHLGFVRRVVRRLAKLTRPGMFSILDSED